MFSKMTEAAKDSNVVMDSKWPRELKKSRSVAVPLSEEQHAELLTMMGPPQTA